MTMDPKEQSEQMEEVRSSERGFVDEPDPNTDVEQNDDESADTDKS